MTLFAPDRTSEISVVDRSFDSGKASKKGVNQLTNATVTGLYFASSSASDGFTRHARPSVFDRAVMRLSVAMLRWARNHADRSFRSWDELALINRDALDRETRENAAPLGPLRFL
jgi:hypothetical protein